MKRRIASRTPLREALDEVFDMPVDEVRVTLVRKSDHTFDCEIQVGNDLCESHANGATEAVMLAIDKFAFEKSRMTCEPPPTY